MRRIEGSQSLSLHHIAHFAVSHTWRKPMNIYRVVNEPCEICLKEYVHNEVAKLSNLPDNQSKASKINQIIYDSHKNVKSVSVELTCKNLDHIDASEHHYCITHLYEMIDAIKEYEDDCNDPSLP